MPIIKKPKPMDRFPEPEDIIRFLQKVECNPSTDCWEWQGYTDPKGYGQFKLYGKTLWAARVSHLIFKGPLPAGMEAHHDENICLNPGCVNPQHLHQLTKAENTAEGNRRRRKPKKGGVNGHALFK